LINQLNYYSIQDLSKAYTQHKHHYPFIHNS